MATRERDDEEEARHAERLAALEDEMGGFPGVTGILALRRRSVDASPVEYKDWKAMEAAIRPEIAKDFLREVKRAISADLLSAAMNTMWREVIRDLRGKVERFGLEHISALEGLPPIEEPAALAKVQDRDLLRACYKLGILDLESLIKLTNGWMLVTFHDSPGASPPDRLELTNFIKNCIRHCLSVEGKPRPEDDTKLPEELLARRVERASQRLFEAHNDFNNFENEVEPARKLEHLAFPIPASARESYVKAVCLSFLGNPYGSSYKAQPHLIKMLDRFDPDLVSTFFDLLEADPDFRSTLMSERPAGRLIMLIDHLRPHIPEGDARRLADHYMKLSPRQIAADFASSRVKGLLASA